MATPLDARPDSDGVLRSLGVAVRRRRICVLSEDLSGHPDEGVKKTTWSLAESLRREHDVLLMSTEGTAPAPGGVLARAPRTFVSRRLRDVLVAHRAEVILYVARSSATFLSFVRARILKAYSPHSLVALVALQPRRLGRVPAMLAGLLRPDVVFVQSPTSRDYLRRLGCAAELLPSGVDVATFCPVDPARRAAHRATYGLRSDVPMVLHVGHLTTGRGVGILAELAARGDVQVVLVASSSTRQEAALADRLRRSGVVVLTEYLAHVEHLYQTADCYVFPVVSSDHAIEVPLSILEAFACDVPVVTTRFGGLPRLFAAAGCPSLRFVDSSTEIVDLAARLAHARSSGTRRLVEPYTWDAVAAEILDRLPAKEPVHAS